MREADLLYRRLFCVLLLVAAAMLGRAAIAADDEPAQFIEDAVSLPAFPKAENLVAFDVSAATSNRFYIDAPSVSLGQDGVVRMTFVIESASGVRNISYEGIRCATTERKTYAYGRADGTWSPARNPAWQAIRENTLNRHHAELFRNYICVTDRTYRTPEQLVGYIRRGEVPLAR